MRLDPSDAQVQRHAMGQLAEAAFIMAEELKRVGLNDQTSEQLLVEWWKVLIASAMQPNFAEILQGLIPKIEEDED